MWVWQDLTEWTESGGCRRLRVWLWSAGCHTETTDGRCEALWSCHCGYSWSCCFSTSWWQKKYTLIKKNIRNFSKYGQVWGCDSQHSQSLKATEHPTSNRVHLIGCEVKLIDRGRAFKCPILNLCDLVVAEVTVCLWGEKESMSEN